MGEMVVSATDIVQNECTGRLQIVMEYGVELAEIFRIVHHDMYHLLRGTNARLKLCVDKLSDSLGAVRALRRAMAERDGSETWKQKELLADVTKLREELHQQREENKQFVSITSTPAYDEHVVSALSNSYEKELEILRTQIAMMKNNCVDIRLSDLWLRNELNIMEQSVLSSSRAEAMPAGALLDDADGTAENKGKRLASHSLRVLRPFIDQSTKKNICPPVDASCSLECERIIRQDYVFLKLGRHWSRLYCVLSQTKTLLFFDNPNDVSQTRHIVTLKSVKRARQVSSPSQKFAIGLELCKEAGGKCVEMAFRDKTERSLWLVLLIAQIPRVQNQRSAM
ncbi:hypothetical protein TraAM80_05367 [Trypanosoma rangeli]|uniref:PH domain-containing protein n=1 Tax=Trypanosoma rangeli TaxID=5698 RepID=A0A3R7LVB4_TRYRA|nr:uncharacterized protein TraAM80_05367 [Trypanosoma rangeli]RNF03983.1 hypothetical protein TraAM80_05367 [Trypanosoma rangeli]|eukprot:RNF03983.1 hypothetical protein TraAM80_05367 [Trypanosoma rangeli]